MSVSGRRKPVHRGKKIRLCFSVDWMEAIGTAVAVADLALREGSSVKGWIKRKRAIKRARQRRQNQRNRGRW